MASTATSRAGGTARPRVSRSTRPRAAGQDGSMAAGRAISATSVRLPLPGLGTLALPPPQSLAFYAGLLAIGTAGIIDWPVVAVLGLGHLLAEDHHHRLLQSFGEALGEA
jgi:hypothetical protein